MTSSYKIPTAIVFAGVMIATAIYISTPRATTPANTLFPERMTPVDAPDHILGNPAAPVIIVEYCDFESAIICDEHLVQLRNFLEGFAMKDPVF